MKIPQQARQPQNMNHWILGSVLILVAVFLIVAISYVNTHASTNTHVLVSGVSPTVDSAAINSSSTYSATSIATLSITPGSVHHYYINGTVSDGNGYTDITTVGAMLYRYGATCPDSPNDANCYSVSCTLGSGSGTSRTYSCDVALNYYADATTAGPHVDAHLGGAGDQGWIAGVKVTDASSNDGFSSEVYTEVDVTGSLGFPTSIDFSTLNSGDSTTTANNVTTAVTQAGNEESDVKVSGTDLTCSPGTLDKGNLQWIDGNLYSNGDYGSTNVHVLTGSPSAAFLDIPLQTSGTVPSKDIFWNINIPLGVSGDCTGQVTMTAIAH